MLAVEQRYSLADYRSLEERSEQRHEYANGLIWEMPGGSIHHSRIATEICNLLISQLDQTQFEVFNSDLRLWIPTYQRGTYPDVMVIAGPPQRHDDRDDEVLNPCFLVEVLSPSTELFDRDDKFRFYRSIPEFAEYLLVRQDEPFITHFWKLDDSNWQFCDYCDRTQAIALKTLPATLPIAQIYRRVVFRESK
ncbi:MULTISPECIES: Uma2 family endonuclease [unclassified Limnothrix]|uniref:Uma2 family endonuclease n=1 Tax=unclassified Limnothrix TaxID=2632864 RepID=UPI0018EF7A81|nr:MULTISPECIES: Uma2 family endonuclease [unclassified Limnothrix]